MQSEIIAMLVPETSLSATMLIRRADGQFAFARIDTRVAVAARVAAGWSRKVHSTEHTISSSVRPRDIRDAGGTDSLVFAY
jgi:hypothetical protein